MKKHVYNMLIKNMTDKYFLKEISITKNEMVKIIKEENFTEGIIGLDFSHKIKARDACDIILHYLNTFTDISAEDLLSYAYDYIRCFLFPYNFPFEPSDELERAILIFYQLFHTILQLEREYLEFSEVLHFDFLEKNLYDNSLVKKEYSNFLSIWDKNYIYEFLRISSEITTFDTLGHIAGVHYVSMHIAYGLHKVNVPIDLALVSGAAVTHDIGKFGCRDFELGRLPYLHYYYTDEFTRRFKMPIIGHIAANHSTWDLELEDLSIENLILIYADFRVKSIRDEDNRELVQFYSLKDSFDVILNKLDNVDEVKLNRYKLVYSKLKDFEEYIESLGVNTDLSNDNIINVESKDNALLSFDEAIDKFKFMAIEHNLYVMNKMNNDASLSNVLETAKSEKQWKNIRAYINILEEYFTYMTQKQKEMTLDFLYEILMHNEGDVRRKASRLMGEIIASYDEKYRKELPRDVDLSIKNNSSINLYKKYLNKIIYPSYKVTKQHKRWLWYSLKRLINSTLLNAQGIARNDFLDTFLLYFDSYKYDEDITFVLIDTIIDLDFGYFTEGGIKKVLKFLQKVPYMGEEIELDILRVYKSMLEDGIDKNLIMPYYSEFISSMDIDLLASRYLIFKISKLLDPISNNKLEEHVFYNEETISKIFLEDLKVATSGVIKKIYIDILKEYIEYNENKNVLRVANHLSNLIVISTRLFIREKVGELLINVMPLLSYDERNEIVIELTKGLESEEYQYAKYLPKYLGRLALFLPPSELDEIIYDNYTKLIEGNNDNIVMVTLNTLGTIIKYYYQYAHKFKESNDANRRRLNYILGLIMRGLAHYHNEISLESFNIIGNDIFGAKDISIESKYSVFKLIYKKILTILDCTSKDELSFFNRAAALNNIYRFISSYRAKIGRFDIEEKKKIAFFPGTFDPFSLGHKGIVHEVSELGFEVYLALDEFSWSKKTQPKIIRRDIVNMSISSEGNAYLFPDDIPINIANIEDLGKLRRIFKDKEVYIVVGSDVIKNASAYTIKPVKDSIHNFNHIIFRRGRDDYDSSRLLGKVIKLELEREIEEVSSSRIRDNIDNNRSISQLLDPIAERYIYDNNLYLREPQYKQMLEQPTLSFEILKSINEDSILLIEELLDKDKYKINGKFNTLNRNQKIIILKENNRILSFMALHEISISNFHKEFTDKKIINYLRNNAYGKVILIDFIALLESSASYDYKQLLLTEALSYCLKEEITYAVCSFKNNNRKTEGDIKELLYNQGFLEIETEDDSIDCFTVDMRYPIAIIQNIDTYIKAPFNKNKNIIKALNKAHKKLQRAMTKLYKGSLVISYNASYMNSRIVELVTKENNVPSKPRKKRVLGEKMCVPFDKILRETLVPNTVTKAIYTEKVYSSDASNSHIEEYPKYSTLSNQIKTIKSFNRPIILADDILHKGDRMKRLYPLLEQEKVNVNKVIVGILSGQGQELMDSLAGTVESVYYIPNLRAWFTESTMYPFIGGDYVEHNTKTPTGMLPVINLIMPYVVPRFLEDISWQSIFDLSYACLNNTKDIFKVLEQEYQKEMERKLTLRRLSEVIIEPNYPDLGVSINYDMSELPSVYIQNDIEKMNRMVNLFD